MSGSIRLRSFFRTGPFVAAQRFLPNAALTVVQRTLFPMPKQEAARVLQGLMRRGVPFVLAGGWAVDALVPGLERRHADLDVIVAPSAVSTLVAVLAEIGYTRTEDFAEGGWWAPVFTVFRDAGGRRIEALPLTQEQLDLLARRAEELLGHGVDGAPVIGLLEGVEVACLPAALQLAAHDGFAMNYVQRKDFRHLDVLARR